MTEAEIASRREAMRQHEEALIAKVGWMIRGVGPGGTQDGSEGAPPFSYTIGLHDKGVPELIVMGLADKRGMWLLNEIATRLVAEPTLRGKIETENWSMPFYLLDADTAKVADNYAFGARRRSDGQATYVQVVLPDREGKFPWEAGCDERFKAALPLVGTPPL